MTRTFVLALVLALALALAIVRLFVVAISPIVPAIPMDVV